VKEEMALTITHVYSCQLFLVEMAKVKKQAHLLAQAQTLAACFNLSQQPGRLPRIQAAMHKLATLSGCSA
jgi:hypothetical protein